MLDVKYSPYGSPISGPRSYYYGVTLGGVGVGVGVGGGDSVNDDEGQQHTTEEQCKSIGHYWYDGGCYSNKSERQRQCESKGDYWDNDECLEEGNEEEVNGGGDDPLPKKDTEQSCLAKRNWWYGGACHDVPNLPSHLAWPKPTSRKDNEYIKFLREYMHEIDRLRLLKYNEAVRVAQIVKLRKVGDALKGERDGLKGNLNACMTGKVVLDAKFGECMGLKSQCGEKLAHSDANLADLKGNLTACNGASVDYKQKLASCGESNTNLKNEISNQKDINSQLMDNNHVLKTDNAKMAQQLGQVPPPPEWYEDKKKLAMAGGGIAIATGLLSWFLMR